MDLLQELRDIEEIKKLKARYCYYVDEGRWDELMELWTEDAVAEYGPWGTYSGKESLGKFFREFVPTFVPFITHMVHNPLISVDGDSASGQWYFECAGTVAPANRAVWIMGRYDETYQRATNDWKFKSLKVSFKYFTPYDEGWVKTPMMTG